MRVRWLERALGNLDEIGEYIARDNPRAASAVVEAIWRKTQGLQVHPELGRPGRVEGTRELVIPGLPYLVAYRLRGDSIEILRVLHAARRWPRKL